MPAVSEVTGNVTYTAEYTTETNTYYYVNGVKTYAGLIEIDGDFYYVNSKFEVIHGRNYFISKTNGLMEQKTYYFDAEGKLVQPDAEKNGIVKESDDTWYYYVDGVKTYAGLIQIDDDYRRNLMTTKDNTSVRVVTLKDLWGVFIRRLWVICIALSLTLKLIPPDVFANYREQAKGMWVDGRPKKWYYAIPIILVWALIVFLVARCKMKLRIF